jgi:hypothetical protein
MGAGVMPAGAAVRSHTAKNPESNASDAERAAPRDLHRHENPPIP